MAIGINALDLIDSELAKSSAPKASKKPIFLFFKEGHKALVRPLSTLKETVVLQKHYKYNEDATKRVNSFCAVEIDKPCKICQYAEASGEKKLNANIYFYLPVYVYKVVDANGVEVKYTEKDDAGNESEKAITGIRLIELARFGAAADILKYFREFMRDDDNVAMTECDFTITQSGANQQKSYVIMSKTPKSMPDNIKKIIPTPETVQQRLLEALPPLTLDAIVKSAPAKLEPIVDEVDEDDIPNF